MRILPASLLLGLLALPATALAQPSKAVDVQTMATDDCAQARKAGKTCVLSIDDDGTIDGKVPTAGETQIGIIPFGGENSLIRLRHDFIPEILRTAEDID
jgi:hypothetical protein